MHRIPAMPRYMLTPPVRDSIPTVSDLSPRPPSLREQLAVAERAAILDGLLLADGCVSMAAQLLGISRRGLQNRIIRLGLGEALAAIRPAELAAHVPGSAASRAAQ